MGILAVLDGPNVALVSMPWVSAWMPSIQLSILRQCLPTAARCDTYELFLDYAALISNPLYRNLSEAGGIVEEWVFAKDYFEAEGVPMPDGFLDEFPPLGIAERDTERRVVSALAEVSRDYLSRIETGIDWGAYDVIAFSLSIYQTAASLALARRIKRRYPNVKIVFGGNSCVGPAGPAILKMSPYVDVVVRGEAELVFAALVEAIHAGTDLSGLANVVYREGGVIQTTPAGGLHPFRRAIGYPNFDAFFERFTACRITNPERIWLPFESSRGCWWGEKSQCSFCGLHEIMKYRARPADEVIAELDYLADRYGVPRFFATDLIMPNEYYRDFLPELVRSRRDYQFFYELKANVTWQQVALLSAAGVKDAQPGLESLSSSVLRTMRKGQTGAQVVQFLKWGSEFGIEMQWNIIIGTPKEDPKENDLAAEQVPTLYHIKPPRLIHFELDRHSPIFENPAEFGLSNLEPLYIYRFVFPIEDEILKDLVYRFEYDEDVWNGRPPWLSGKGEGYEYPSVYHNAVKRWEAAAARGATCTVKLTDGLAIITDTRFSEAEEIRTLNSAQTALYLFLDHVRNRTSAAQDFVQSHPHAGEGLGGVCGVEALIVEWHAARLMFVEDNRIVAVAVWNPPRDLPADQTLVSLLIESPPKKHASDEGAAVEKAALVNTGLAS